MTVPAPDLERAVADETNRLTAQRLPIGAVAFAVIFAVAGAIELGVHPERARVYAAVFAAELLTVGGATLLCRQVRWRSHAQSVAAGTAIALIAWVGAYHALVQGEAEVLAIALLYLVAGVFVLLPMGWRRQLAVALSALVIYAIDVALGERRATPLPLDFLGLGAICALSVAGSAFRAHQRWTVFGQAAELRATNAALAEANAAKNQFLASVSHELRTPLNIIVGYTDLLIEGHFGLLPGDAIDALERIARNSGGLVYLINDLLDLSRMEAGRLLVRLGPVQLGPVFIQMEEFMRSRLDSKDVRFLTSPPTPLSVVADRDRLEQILVNLLSNAVKFTDRGEIALRAQASAGSTVTIEVQDTGVGIAGSELPRIFEPFSQGEIGKQRGGVGIGLSLSSRLATAMGGELSVRSEGGRGSTFSLRLPAAHL